MKQYNYLPKVYVMGTTNSGKSTLLNSMLQHQMNKHKEKNPLRHKLKKKRRETLVLTESALPGTTQEMITVEQLRIGFRIIDTPGIPNMD